MRKKCSAIELPALSRIGFEPITFSLEGKYPNPTHRAPLFSYEVDARDQGRQRALCRSNRHLRTGHHYSVGVTDRIRTGLLWDHNPARQATALQSPEPV